MLAEDDPRLVQFLTAKSKRKHSVRVRIAVRQLAQSKFQPGDAWRSLEFSKGFWRGLGVPKGSWRCCGGVRRCPRTSGLEDSWE